MVIVGFMRWRFFLFLIGGSVICMRCFIYVSIVMLSVVDLVCLFFYCLEWDSWIVECCCGVFVCGLIID